MRYEVINNIITGDGPLRNSNSNPIYANPGDELFIYVTTRYKSDGDISITTGINKVPIPFTMTGPGVPYEKLERGRIREV